MKLDLTDEIMVCCGACDHYGALPKGEAYCTGLEMTWYAGIGRDVNV